MYNYVQTLTYKHIKIKVEKFSAHYLRIFPLCGIMHVYDRP